MNKTLALKLKEAGFPQIIKNHFFCEVSGCEKEQFYDGKGCDHYDADWIAIPYLEELIEAVGEDFGELRRLSKGGEFEWYALKSQEFTGYYGSTPIEAVANLWLKLHGKDE